jgi:hypothetical protein
MYFYNILSLNVSDKICSENHNTFYVQTLLSKNGALYETMWRNTVNPDRTQMTLYYGACTLHAGYLRLRHTIGIYSSYCFSTEKIIMRTRLNVAFTRPWPVLFSVPL